MWGVTLSRPLRIIGLVGLYPTNYLIRRRPIPKRPSQNFAQPCDRSSSCGISPAFAELFPTSGQVTYVLRTRPPLTHSEKRVRSTCMC